MGKLILESYTKNGCIWLNKDTFFNLCTTVRDAVNKSTHLVAILTDIERKGLFLEGAEPLYGLSYVFKQNIADVKELETKDGLAKEQKIIVLDDLAHTEEKLVNDNGSKLWILFATIMSQQSRPYQMGLDMQYYRAKEAKQLVLPINQKDMVYLIGDDLLLDQTHLK